MQNKSKKLSTKETKAQTAFIKTLRFPRRKTKRPVVVALAGLVGSGKSSVAKALAPLLGATIIEGDAIRIELRKQDALYKSVRTIGQNAVSSAIEKGSNVIIDSDHANKEKHNFLKAKITEIKAYLFVIRVHSDPDTTLGRMISGKYGRESFFGGASSSWQGAGRVRGAVVKIREMWRRTPHHYEWVNEVGGKWKLKKLPVPVFANVDTSTSAWKVQVKKIARKILKGR